MGGYEKAKATAEKLKEEKAEKEQAELANREQAENALASLEGNSDLAKMFNDSAKLGTENLSGGAPWLKVHAAGRSTTNFLADGKTMPDDGNFFYTPTQEQFKEIECHILTISKGFRTVETDPKGVTKEVFNQLIGGMIMNDGDPKPFIMFVRGKRLSPMWEFGKEIAKWTSRKPIAVPMFTMKVKLTTHMEKNDYSYSWLIDFTLEKVQDIPVVTLDEGQFTFLKDSVSMMQEQISSLIANKEKKDVVPTKLETDPEENFDFPLADVDGESAPVNMG